jgi:hypothetical protein
MIMRLTGIVLISAIVGACAALAPIPRTAPLKPVHDENERHEIRWHSQKIVPKRIDPAVEKRLDSIDEELRAWQRDLNPKSENDANLP